MIDWAGLGIVVKEPRLPSFGLVVAYLLPGFTAVWGAAYLDETLSTWLLGADSQSPTVGGFLYVTIASLAAGMAANTARWLLVDTLLRRSGVPRRRWDFSRLQRHIDAYSTLTEHHYRHYQFFGSMLIALAFAFAARRLSLGLLAPLGWPDIGLLLLGPLFAAGAYDTFRKYYSRLDQLLDASTPTAAVPDSPGLRQAIRETSTRVQTEAEQAGNPRRPAYTR